MVETFFNWVDLVSTYYSSSANYENARISEAILVYTKAIYYSIFTLVVISNTEYTTIQYTYIDCNL